MFPFLLEFDHTIRKANGISQWLSVASYKNQKFELFLAKRGRRPRVAGFIILSLKGLRRDEISCGVYGHIYLFIYL